MIPTSSKLDVYQRLFEMADHIGQEKLTKHLLLSAYWSVGQCLETLLPNADKDTLLVNISQQLSARYGKRFRLAQLKQFCQFYKEYPKWHPYFAQLTWSHLRLLLRVSDIEARAFYLEKCHQQQWSVGHLKRQIQTQFHQRIKLRKAPSTTVVSSVLSGYCFEFSGLAPKNHFQERQLEQALLERLPFFLLELGQGFAFVAQQKKIVLPRGDRFYIDLVFYNYLESRFVLLELKTRQLRHHDVGQIDLYRRFYDQHYRQKNDRPTAGILLGKGENPSLNQFSLLADVPELIAASYTLDFPESGRAKFELVQSISDWLPD